MSFYRLEGSDQLPFHLRRMMPNILWLDEAGLPERGTISAKILISGYRLGDENQVPLALVVGKPEGGVDCRFDLPRAIEGTLLEKYHGGLEPALEMRLPFNYSLLPPWIKGAARFFRAGKMTHDAEIHFPSKEPQYVVDWLRGLAVWAGLSGTFRSQNVGWPGGCRAAITISHDVDTDWLFLNPDWLERFCDLEEKHGFFGAWYCVPCYSTGRKSIQGIERLKARGCEIGCHGYNHDAKWPLLTGPRFERRLEVVRAFRDRWQARGFRSEWLWRTPAFLSAIAGVFAYDSSVPTSSSSFTRMTRNGCGTCMPYQTFGGMIELPLTLPMDEARHATGVSVDAFWETQVGLAEKIVDQGGLVTISLHPQPHQAANRETLEALDRALQRLSALSKVWVARPDQIAEHVRKKIIPG